MVGAQALAFQGEGALDAQRVLGGSHVELDHGEVTELLTQLRDALVRHPAPEVGDLEVPLLEQERHAHGPVRARDLLAQGE